MITPKAPNRQSLLSVDVPVSGGLPHPRISQDQLASMRAACQRHLDQYMASEGGEKDFATFCRALARTAAEYRLPDTPGGQRSRMIGLFFDVASSKRRGVGRPKNPTEHSSVCLYAWLMINAERAEYGERPLKRPPADQIADWLRAKGWLDLTANEVRTQLGKRPR